MTFRARNAVFLFLAIVAVRGAILVLDRLGDASEGRTLLPGHSAPQEKKPERPQTKIVMRWGQGDEVADFWVYEDLAAGLKMAAESGKPALVTYRCVP